MVSTAQSIASDVVQLRLPGRFCGHLSSCGKRYCHIFDPRTGQPIEGVLSVTVKAQKVTNADALATTLFVLGPEKGKEFL